MSLKDFLEGSSPEIRYAKKREDYDKLPAPIKNADELRKSAMSNIDLGFIDKAVQQLTEARRIYIEENDFHGYIHSNLHLALIFEELNDLHGALVLYEGAVKACRAIDSKWDETTVLLEKAVCHLKLGQRAEAKSCYDRAFELATEINDKAALNRIEIESLATKADYQIKLSDDEEYRLR